MTTEIKINRKIYEIKKGDYVQYNGACYLFCAGDRRTLRYGNFTNFSYIRLTAKAVKELDLKSLKEVKQGEVTRYYF